MYNKAFGEVAYNVGWKTKMDITLFGKCYNVIVKAKAYYERDGITIKQEETFLDYIANKVIHQKSMEQLLREYSDNAETRFTPKTILFERDGACAVLFDDAYNPDEGIALCLYPNKKIMLQDDYL